MTKIDNIIQPKDVKWEFNSEVANCFEDMLSRSIPQYNIMRNCIKDLIDIQTENKLNFSVLDIGCSNGLMIEKIWKPNGNYLGVDISKPMLKKAQQLFENKENVLISECDLRESFPMGSYDIITCVLSLLFTPIEYRQSIVQNIYNSLNKGGSLFLVEKVLGNNDALTKLFNKNYYKMKADNGYSQEQIDRKRLSLEGVQVPVTSDWNMELLKQAGFKQIDVFWRWCNFMGIIAIK